MPVTRPTHCLDCRQRLDELRQAVRGAEADLAWLQGHLARLERSDRA